MPSIEKHVEISMQRTGKPYRQVHDGKFTHLVEDVQALVNQTLTYFGAKKL